MQGNVEEIKAKLNIIDVLGEYIRLDKAGSNYRALCPFHNEKSPSFMISEEKQFWHCFGCQKGGDIFAFVMEIEGLEFREALKLLAEKAGVELKSYNPQKTEEKNRTLEILELATKFYEVQLWKGVGKNNILGYLRGRGFSDEIVKEFRLGYAPNGWKNVLTFLLKRGYKTEEILRAGLLVQKSQVSDCYDRFRNRIMFPIAETTGKIVGYSARVSPGGDESQAKYVNTPETEVYHKSKILYGIDRAKMAIKKDDFVLLVEGNADVIAASLAGLKNTVAVSGTALTEEQLNIIKRYTRNIKMFFDMDAAGQAATKKSLQLCFQKDFSVSVVTLPQGKDAADLAKDAPEKLLLAVKNDVPAMEYLISTSLSRYDKNTAEGKKKISLEVISMLANLENAVEKNHWIKNLSQKLDVPEATLTDVLKKATLKERIVKADEKGITSANSFVERNKEQILAEEVIKLMLVSSLVWKQAPKVQTELAALKDSLLREMLETGEKYNWEFDDFAAHLENVEKKSRVEKMYFEKKFQLDLNNNLVETIIENPLAEFENILKEVKKENRKKILEHITKDLQMAEKNRDVAAKGFLRQEFKRVSEELLSLG